MTFLKHKCGRPPTGAVEVLALRHDGKWIDDDGKKHRAFSYRLASPSGVLFPCMIAMGCECLYSDDCPARMAMGKTCARWHASNGERFA